MLHVFKKVPVLLFIALFSYGFENKQTKNICTQRKTTCVSTQNKHAPIYPAFRLSW